LTNHVKKAYIVFHNTFLSSSKVMGVWNWAIYSCFPGKQANFFKSGITKVYYIKVEGLKFIILSW